MRLRHDLEIALAAVKCTAVSALDAHMFDSGLSLDGAVFRRQAQKLTANKFWRTGLDFCTAIRWMCHNSCLQLQVTESVPLSVAHK
jgi:hypothetical protein